MSRRAARGLLIFVMAVVGYESIGVRTQSTPAPILIVTNGLASNPFDAYLPEILRAEGLNQFAVKDVTAVQATDLPNAGVVVLAETTLTAGQANLFSNYVAGGGRLVAMKPDNQLAPVLGLTPVGSTTTEGYFAINTAVSFADGFPTATLPFHGQAVNYTMVNGATSLATLFTNATTATSFPAVVRFGRTVTWTYDVARSIVYTRQGNPANATDRDGSPPYRTEDIFYNAIDKDKVSIPYADVQMRMLGRAISDLMADAMPLARLWYFPNGNHSLLVITSDSHANPQSYFDAVVASVESRGARDTFYMFNGGPSVSSVNTWIARGHEFGMHPAGYQNGVTLTQAFQNNLNWFLVNGYAPPSPTVRIHQLEWQGWVDGANIEASSGVTMDTSYYTWGPAVTYPDGHQAHGYVTGSGLPMRFIDQTGAIVPVYQQTTSVIDEQLLVSDFSENLTTDQALTVTKGLIDDSQAGGYSAITTQFHVDYYQFGQVQPWAEGTMDYANSLAIPIWTAQRWLNYTTARAATTMTGFAWDPVGRQLAFTVNVPTGSERQSLALPGTFGTFSLSSVLVDGAAAIAAPDTISGRSTRFVNLSSGTHTISATYGTSTPPTDHPPIANPDTANVNEGQTVVVPVLANDTDADGDTLKVDSTSPDSGAVITINADQTVSYTPKAGTCGSDTFTYTIDDGRGGTASSTVTVTTTCFSGQVVHSTYADFAQSCAVPTSSIVTRVGDGEVRLAGAFGDEYTGTTLDASKWVAGTWTGGTYTPAPSGGILSLSNSTGAYVRSVSTLPMTTLESSVRFTALPWEHVGWGSLNFGAGYAMFSTYNTSTSLFARTADTSGTETQTNLGPIPQGFHTYRIDRQAVSSTSDQISYYIDGTLSAQHTVATLPQMYVYQSENGGTTPTLDIDRIWVYPSYTSSGTYQSCTMDIGQTASTWSTANWSVTAPASTAFDLRTRSSTDGSTWSAWSSPLTSTGSAITSPAGRYLQYLAEFTSTDPNQSPVLDSVTMQYSNGGGPTLPSLSINDVSVTEGNSGTVNATFTVTLSPASSQNVTVAYATAGGTATSGVDFMATSGTLTFAAGATSQSIVVPVIGDTVAEPNETFVVNLSNATNASISRAQGVGTIINDDASGPLPTLSINDVSITEGNSGTSNATFTVSLSAASTQTVTVNYATAGGTATSGTDFTAVSGTLTFAAGTTTRPIQVPIVGDTIPEANETFTVNLTGAVGATIARASGTGTIVDNDGTIRVTAPNTGVTWVIGTTRSITWTNNLGTGATVRLEVSRDGGSTWSLITSSVANSSSTGGSFNWTVSGPATTTARIRATWTVNGAVTDTSDVNFTIANPSITVNSPNGGGTWTVGTTVSVTWSSNLPSTENVRIDLSTNGGASYSTVLRSSTSNDGTQSFTVQSAWRSTQARIRVSWVANTSVNDTSNANFTIR
jgi:Big-like domain-containing protein/Calx-beta domain-containing protein